MSPPLGLDCVGAGYNRKVQSPPLGLDCVGAGYNRKIWSPPLGLDCVGAGCNRNDSGEYQANDRISHVCITPFPKRQEQLELFNSCQ